MIVAIVPARGGSKRIPRKNIALLHGRPLLVYTLDAAVAALGRDRVFVSTDDRAVARVAEDAGVAVIERPAALASDSASTESALIHALEDSRVVALGAKWMMTLPPTSPLRGASAIRGFLAKVGLEEESPDCYLSMTESRGDYWRSVDGRWSRLFPDAPRRQQDRAPLYEENSAIYLTSVRALRATGSILGHQPQGVPIDRLAGFDVNEPADLEYADWALGRRG
jgi:CMP-N,N'-diacetyllegionaminic acid synthase